MPDPVVSIQAKRFSSGQWKYAPQAPHDNSLPTSLNLITWNIDFATPEAARRLTAALDYLQFNAFPEQRGGKPPHCLILLQEINIDAFDTLLAHPWVQEWFRVVPGSAEAGWPKGAWYGTVTLVHAPLAKSVCVHFEESWMQRNALVTDITVSGRNVLRVVNTHLESLPMGMPLRVKQMGAIAGMLKEKAGTLVGGIACGDMNAISPEDTTLAEKNGLLDAWERGGGGGGSRREGDEAEGTTWGYQPRSQYPPGRLDKILYTESEAFEIRDVRRIAVDLKMSGGDWVSDHYGLACRVEVKHD